MQYTIQPYVSAGPLQLGMNRNEVRNILAVSYSSFKKTPMAETLTDFFNGIGIHVYYNKTDQCEAIEFALPAEPILMGNNLLGRPFIEVRDLLSEMDPTIETDESGLISLTLGIGLYVPTLKKSLYEPIEGVIVFERGYYD